MRTSKGTIQQLFWKSNQTILAGTSSWFFNWIFPVAWEYCWLRRGLDGKLRDVQLCCYCLETYNTPWRSRIRSWIIEFWWHETQIDCGHSVYNIIVHYKIEKMTFLQYTLEVSNKAANNRNRQREARTMHRLWYCGHSVYYFILRGALQVWKKCLFLLLCRFVWHCRHNLIHSVDLFSLIASSCYAFFLVVATPSWSKRMSFFYPL